MYEMKVFIVNIEVKYKEKHFFCVCLCVCVCVCIHSCMCSHTQNNTTVAIHWYKTQSNLLSDVIAGTSDKKQSCTIKDGD